MQEITLELGSLDGDKDCFHTTLTHWRMAVLSIWIFSLEYHGGEAATSLEDFVQSCFSPGTVSGGVKLITASALCSGGVKPLSVCSVCLASVVDKNL